MYYVIVDTRSFTISTNAKVMPRFHFQTAPASCFTATFLHINDKPGSMRMIDDDEVGLKEMPKDTRYITIL